MTCHTEARSHSSIKDAASQLVRRVIPGQAGQFIIEIISAADGRDVFEVASRGQNVVLRGNSAVSIASALNWYLQNQCHCDIFWNCGERLDVPQPLPAVPQPVRIVSPHAYRYAYNFCTHGYTTVWWEWAQWERELDYLALNGANLALIIQGQESVWLQTLMALGYSEAEGRAWHVMPTHQPWMYMDNMENHGEPLPAELVQRRLELGQQILTRMRELGIAPVLPGYYGMVPPDFKNRFPQANVHTQGCWFNLRRPDILDPTDPMFAQVASAFYAAQNQLFGGADFYAADPFHEGGSTANMNIPEAGRAILAAMDGAIWIIQSWHANPRQEMIDPLDKNRLLVLDLFCEDHENWRLRNHFNDTPWLWCTIHNFGGNVDMGGRLAWMGEGPVAALNDPQKGRLSGIGALMEGSQVNPVVWELFFGNAWRSTAPDLERWLKDYSHRRCGQRIPAAEQAWKILAETIYNAPVGFGEYPLNSVICARPSLNPDQRARDWVGTRPYYDPTRLVEAWRLMLDAAPKVTAVDGYFYDLCFIGRQVLADLGTRYHHQIIAAYRAKDMETVRRLSRQMLALILDLDELVGTRREFLFGTWLSDARLWGKTLAEKNRCARSARELLTVWTDKDSITDYANRQWNGLLRGFYHQRWALWLEAMQEALARGEAMDEQAVRATIRDWELAWIRQHDRFPNQPQGDVVQVSRNMFEKYSTDAATPWP
jgi:alpha-N-acetylglucosaminidase